MSILNSERKNLGEIIRQKRVIIPLTLQQLAAMSGVSASHLGRIEKGDRFPSASILRKIAQPLGFDEAELFTLAGYLPPQPTIIAEKELEYSGGRLEPSATEAGLLTTFANQIGAVINKANLYQQIKQREEQLALVNKLTSIITSSPDISQVYEGFAAELKKAMDADWAGIVLIEGKELHFLALSTEIGSAWELGEPVPLEGTATEWVAATKKALVEPDLEKERRFWTGEYHLKQGVRSIVYLPLLAKGEVFGTLVIASRRPFAYRERELALLEHLVGQISMPILNAKLHQNLLESEKRFQDIAANTGDWVWEVDADGRYTYASPVVERVLGYLPEEVVGKFFYDFSLPDERQQLKAAAFKVFARKESFVNFLNSNVHKDGRIVILETSGVPILDRDGNLLGYRGVDRDVTERRLAIKEIVRQSQELEAISRLTRVISSNVSLDRVFDTFTQELKGLVGCDRLSITFIEGDRARFLAVSSTVETELKMGGTYPLKDSATGWVAKHRKTLTHPDLAQESSLSHGSIKLKAGLRSCIHVPLFSKGEVFGCLNLSSFQPNAYGEREQKILEQLAAQIAGFIENTRLYSQEKAERITLERQAREGAEFIAAISHELKTPLTSIIASGDLLSEEIRGEEQEPQRRLIQNIVNSAHSLRARLDELMDAGKKGVRAPQLQLKPLDIKFLLEDAKAQVSPIVKSKEQSLILDLPDSLPLVGADAHQLEQVLLNLLTNATKFTPKGGSIILRAKKGDANLIIEVQDSGIGIPKEEQAKLFQPYYRAESDRQGYPGLGLGLALAKQIVELHSGRIWVESEWGKGSTFAFSLPL